MMYAASAPGLQQPCRIPATSVRMNTDARWPREK